MYKEVALDPSLITDIQYYNLIKQQFGFEKGRYISADLNKWRSEAMNYVKGSDLKTIEQQSIKNFLNKMMKEKKLLVHDKKILLTEDRKKINSSDWVDWFNQQQSIRKFSCCISNKVKNGIDINDINDNCKQWYIPPSTSIERKSDKIIESLYPLLQLSSDVTLIDPYFRLVNNNILSKLIATVNKLNVKFFRVATAMETASIESVFNKNYRSMIGENLKFEWIKAPEKYFHDRYLITNVGAIRSGQGFSESTEKGIHSDFANINIISYEEADRTLCSLQDLLNRKIALIQLSA